LIYEVTLDAPQIHEIVTTAADSEEQAIQFAVYSAVQRMLKAGTATCKVLPLPPPEAA
jgi:hypothetical protein